MKINKIFEIVWSFMKKYILIIGGFIFTLFMINKCSKLGEVKYNKKWKPIPGIKTKVQIKNSDGKTEVIDLPVNPKTGNQITIDEIKQVGLPEKNKEEVLYVEIIKNSNIDRRSVADM